MHPLTICAATGIVLATLFARVEAQIPQGYYQSASGLVGEELQAALHEIIDDHAELSYSDAYDALAVLDRDPNNADRVIGIYSGFAMNADERGAAGDGWNREHVWPQSFGGLGRKAGAGSDLHHLRAEDFSTNSARNNRSFQDGGTPYFDQSGSYSGATECKRGSPGYTWEARPEVKGDIARMVFYMVVRYEGDVDGEPDLELTEKALPQSNKSPLLGVKSTLLKWHEQDPVDESERSRNDAIFVHYQHNRNPFIDHPEFVERIWGTSAAPSRFSVYRNVELYENEVIETIQVGTFNLYWLGYEMRYKQGLRSQEDVQRLADLVTDELDLEVVVFQEVNTSINGPDKEGRMRTDQEYKWLMQAMQPKGYAFIAGTSGGAQRVVIAYDKDEVRPISHKELKVRTKFTFPGDCSSQGLRRPLAAQFRAGKFDFWTIGVHLKSQRNADCSDLVRAAQADDLLAAIDSLVAESNERDVIIVGDFNSSARDESIAAFYDKGNFTTLTWPGRMSSESGEYSYLPERFADIIDHIMVRTDSTKEMIAKSATVYEPENTDAYIENYSDHAPVWASFATAVDDD